MRPPLVFVAALVLSGCATNPYAESYRRLADAKTLGPRIVAPASSEPRLQRVTDHEAVVVQLVAEGYSPLGSSIFRGRRVAEELALDFGRRIGAQVVVVERTQLATARGDDSESQRPRAGLLLMLLVAIAGHNGISDPPDPEGAAWRPLGTAPDAVPTGYAVREYEHVATYWVRLVDGIRTVPLP